MVRQYRHSYDRSKHYIHKYGLVLEATYTYSFLGPFSASWWQSSACTCLLQSCLPIITNWLLTCVNCNYQLMINDKECSVIQNTNSTAASDIYSMCGLYMNLKLIQNHTECFGCSLWINYKLSGRTFRIKKLPDFCNNQLPQRTLSYSPVSR